MTTAPTLVLYGNSIFLAGLKADLVHLIELELVTIDAHLPDPEDRIRQCNPSVVIFDFATAHPDFAMRLLRDRPNLLLLGVDPSRDEVIVVSGRPERALSTQELVRVINGLPGTHHPASEVPDFARFRHLLSAGPLVASRQRKFALAVAAILVFVVIGLTLSLAGSGLNAPLAGAAVTSGSRLPLTAFGAGIVLGAGVIAFWFHRRTHK